MKKKIDFMVELIRTQLRTCGCGVCGNHDEGNGQPVSAIAAALILADKSDVRRSRMQEQDEHKFDVHDRANYSVMDS